jgi:glycogen(starch) synthase
MECFRSAQGFGYVKNIKGKEMKVLMFGWEFPPIISGGLGTATYGITKGLVRSGVDLTLVLPTKRGHDIDSGFEVVAANEIPVTKKYQKTFKRIKSFDKSIFEKKFDVAPYFTKETYKEYIQHFQKIDEFTEDVDVNESILHFTGNYGKDLMSEVTRYGYVGEITGLAEDFDVIHAHDWLTYYAGVAAKNASGKPLVVHVHATEFDRSGENVNQVVYDIERFGMHNADHIIAVSYYTKNIIVNRYGIHPDKVTVVHNAVNKEKRIQRLHLKKNVDEKIVCFWAGLPCKKDRIILWRLPTRF